MGSCCSVATGPPELNPDGEPKAAQTPMQMKDDPTELRRAAREQDIDLMEELLMRMPVRQINSAAGLMAGMESSPDDKGNTALHYSVAAGDAKAVRKLLSYKASARVKNALGKTPYYLACEGGNRAIAQLLMQADADPNLNDKARVSPLMCVMSAGRRKMATWLIENESTGLGGLELVALSAAGDSALLIAFRNGWFDMANTILDKAQGDPAAALNSPGTNRETALGWLLKWASTFALDTALLKRVLDVGAQPNLPSFKEKVPPVCLAAAAGEAEALEMLLTAGADVLACDGQKRSALHYAAAQGKVAMCELLLAKGVPASGLDAKRNTPLHLAGMRGQGEAARVLMSKEANAAEALFVKNKAGVCCYHLALMNDVRKGAGQEAALKLLDTLASSDRLNMPVEDATADTPLLLAVSSHQNEVVKRLLAADPSQASAGNAKGELPLARCLSGVTHATVTADTEILLAILDNISDDPLTVANPAEHPLLALCECHVPAFSEKALGILTAKAGGKPLPWAGLADGAGLSPLCLAAMSDNHFMVRHLLDEQSAAIDEGVAVAAEGAGSSSSPLAGRTPIMLAAAAGALGAMRVLLNRGPALMGADASGRSALLLCLEAPGLDSLLAASLLVQEGCPPEDCLDGDGEGLLHRAVRQGDVPFVEMWARHGGNLGLRCTHAKVAGTGLKGLFAGGGGGGEEEEDVLDSIPAIAQADDDMVVAAEGEEGEEGDAAGPGPIAEGVERWQMAAAEEDVKAAGVETEGAWWDGWLEDVEYEGTAGEADEEVVDAGEVEDMFDLEELVEELLARAAHGRTGPVAAMAGLVNEEGEDEECGDESEGRLLPPGPVAEGLADSMKSPLMSMTGGKKTDKNSDMLGNVLTMWEPKIEVTDPFLIDAAYTGQPAYMQPANVLAAAGDAELDGLAAAVKAAAADVGVEPLLEGEALRLRNMFWYNRGLSPAEFKLKPGQWKKVEKAVAARIKALRKGKKPRRKRNDLPDRPAFRAATPLLMAARLGRLDVMRVLLKYSLREVNVPDGYGVGPLGYAMMHLSRSRKDPVAQAIVDELLLVRPAIEKQGGGVMNPLVIATLLADRARLAFMVRVCAADLDTAPVFLPDIPTYFRSMWQKQCGKCASTVMPLHLAVLHRSKDDLVKLLLDLGADPNLYGRPRDHVKQWAKYNKKAGGAPPGKVAAIIDYVRNFEIPGLSKPNPWVTPLHLAGRFGQAAAAQLLIARGAVLSHFPAVARKTALMEAAAFARKNFQVSNRAAGQDVWKTFRSEGRVRQDDFPPVPAIAIANESKAAMKMLMDYKVLALKVVMYAIKQVVRFVLRARKRPVAHHDPSLATAHVMLWHRAEINWQDTSTAIMLRDVFDNKTYGWLAVPGVPDGTEPGGWAHVAASHTASARDLHFSQMQSAKMVKAYNRERGRLMCTADKVYFKAGQRNFLGHYQPLVDAANAEQQRRAEEGRAAAEATRGAASAKRAEFLKEQLAERSEALQAEADLLSDGAPDDSPSALVEAARDAATAKGAMPTAADIEAAAAADAEAAVSDINPNELLSSLLGKVGSSAAERAAKKRAASKRSKRGADAGAGTSAKRPTQRDEAVVAARQAATEQVKGRLQEEAGAGSDAVLGDVLSGRLPAAPAPVGMPGLPGDVTDGSLEAPAGLLPEDAMAGFAEPPGTDAFRGAGLAMEEIIHLAEESMEAVQEILAKLLDICEVELF
eukprot:jgi/Tetstr1/425640/TSEL_016060.t1